MAEAEEIANERIDLLLAMARELAVSNPARARRYVELARKIGMRHSVRLGARRKLFCKGCLLPLLPGKTSRVRISGGRRIETCTSCGRAQSVSIR